MSSSPLALKALAALERAEQAVRPGSRPFRVDVLNRRIAPARAVYDFFRSRPCTALDTVALEQHNAAEAGHAILAGTLDASFRAVATDQVPAKLHVERFVDSPLQVRVGRSHPLSGADRLRPGDLLGH